MLKKNILGYSLIELLIVLLFTLWFGGSVIWSWKSIFIWIEQRVFITQLFIVLEMAREIAIHRHQLIIICGSVSGKDCDDNWQKGQIIMCADSKKVLYRFQNHSLHFYSKWTGNAVEKLVLIFDPLGGTQGLQGNLTIYTKQKQNAVAKLIITRSGRIREADITEE